MAAVTQRVDVIPQRGERRDALDQQWSALLWRCGFVAVPMPNHPETAEALLARMPISALLLTGGNSLTAYGGNAPERDETEQRLLARALACGWPTVGVCRGMQVIQQHFGVALNPVSGHVAREHAIVLDGFDVVVNSYHELGAIESVPALDVLARSADGVVEAVRHRNHRVHGMMWHPERVRGFDPADAERLRAWLCPW